MKLVSRKLLRWLVRFTVLLAIFGLAIFVTDIKYDFLPSSIQTRLPLHPPDPVLIDLQIRKCGPFRACDDSYQGWFKYSKDLLLGKSWKSKVYMYTRAINENELPAGQDVIVSIAAGKFDLKDLDAVLPPTVLEDLKQLGEPDTELKDRHAGFELAKKHGWELRDEEFGVWVKRAKHTPNEVVTAVKILFGEDAQYPVPSWHLTDLLSSGGSGGGSGSRGSRDTAPRIAFRIGRLEPAAVPKLKFSKAGLFRIMQLTDLHMSTGPGVCDHPVPAVANEALCKADEMTMQFISDAIAVENPDYVVFTGDLIMGSQAPDPETALLKALAPVLARKLPFSVIWGNHDREGPLPNSELMNIVMGLPGAIAKHGPEDIPGDGNYVVTASPANSDYPALSMIFLDSHAKLPQKGAGYDYVRPEQHEFVRREMEEIRAKLHGYSHVPLSMAFQHIPLPEYRDGTKNDEIKRVGSQRENIIGPVYNSGTLKVLRDVGVSVVSLGHDHVNDFCQLEPALDKDSAAKENVWLCYGGSAGFGGYGGYPDNNGDYKRRIRIFEVDLNLPSIDTWHRVQNTRAVKNQVRLVDSGIARFGPEGTDTVNKFGEPIDI